MRSSREVTVVLVACAALAACSSAGRDALRSRPDADARDADAPDADAPDADAPARCDPPDQDAGMPELPAVDPPEVDPALAGQRHAFFALHVVDANGGAPIGGATLRTTSLATYTSDRNGAVAFYEPGLMGERVYFSVEHPRFALEAGASGIALDVTEGGAAEIALTRISDEPFDPPQSDLDTRLLESDVPAPDACFAIRVIDEQTRGGVPLVILETADEQYVSDSQGMVAYCNLDHLGERITFAVRTHGYELAASEVALDAVPGELRTIELARNNVAERLYRATGQGIDRDSILLGRTTPRAEPLLNAGVMEQDAVAAAPFEGRLFWLWGNTDRAETAATNFRASAALSDLPDFARGVAFEYFTDDRGQARGMVADIPPANLLSWVGSLFSVPDERGADRLFAIVSKPHPDLSLERRGLTRFDPASEQFVSVDGVEFAIDAERAPGGQPMTVEVAGETFVYFGTGVRVPARADAVVDAAQYEQLTPRIDRLRDAASGIAINPSGAGAFSYNEYRERFVRIVPQVGGTTSLLGEVWYAEADTPFGPWVYARKVLTHDRYTFYSPWIHGYTPALRGRYVYFEGSYTAVFEGDVELTPRYHRNQIMYRLDLDDARLTLPVAVYDLSGGDGTALGTKRDARAGAVLAPLFFALDRSADGVVPIYWSSTACDARLIAGGEPRTRPLFYAMPASSPTRPAQLVPLYETRRADGRYAYSLEETGELIAYVWPSPTAETLPVGDFAASDDEDDDQADASPCVRPLDACAARAD